MLVFCYICQESLNLCDEETSVLNCGHLFHKICLQQWLTTNSTCPDCKSVVTKNFVQTLYPSVKDDNDVVYKKFSDEKQRLMKADSFKKSDEMLIERIKTLESENLKLTKEKDAFKDENFRFKVQVEQLKSNEKI